MIIFRSTLTIFTDVNCSNFSGVNKTLNETKKSEARAPCGFVSIRFDFSEYPALPSNTNKCSCFFQYRIQKIDVYVGDECNFSDSLP